MVAPTRTLGESSLADLVEVGTSFNRRISQWRFWLGEEGQRQRQEVQDGTEGITRKARMVVAGRLGEAQ